MTVNVLPPKPADLIAEYVWMREQKQAQEKAFEVWVKESYTDRMDEIEAMLLDHFKLTGTDNTSARGIGTAFRKRIVSVTVGDMQAFQRHVIGTEAWELADWKANKTEVTKLVDDGQEPPPGVNFNAMAGVGIRKGK